LTSLANAADSLAAIAQVVFQDRTLALADLNRILLDDFKGNERVRQLLLNRPPTAEIR
jgi:formate C-acetyltransferase